MDIPPLLIDSFNKYSSYAHYVPGTLLGDSMHSYEWSLCSPGIYSLVGETKPIYINLYKTECGLF